MTNMIDAGPTSFPGYDDIDGSPYLLGDLQDGQAISIGFAKAVTAWGADFAGIADAGRPTRLDIYDTASALIGSIAFAGDATGNQQQFYGFTATGDDVGKIAFVDPGPANDVFGVDNIGFVTAASAVPEPSSLAMVAIGGLGLLGARRRRLSD